MVADNEDTGATSRREQLTDPDESLPVSARTSGLRRTARSLLSDSDSEDEGNMEDALGMSCMHSDQRCGKHHVRRLCPPAFADADRLFTW